jgi:DNA-binding NarL/FixJ family response regulator
MVLRQTCDARDKRAMPKGEQESCWEPTRDLGVSRLTMTAQSAKPAAETSGLIWVKCSFPLVVLSLEAKLKAVGYVYCGQEAPVKNAPSSVIYCPNEEEDVASELERLRIVAGNVPILVFGLSNDLRLAQTAFLAGADGFIHRRTQPEQIVRALSAAFVGEALVPRDLLEALLVEKVSRADVMALTPRQREFLELVVEAATFEDVIVSPKELLREFLFGEVSWLEELFQVH